MFAGSCSGASFLHPCVWTSSATHSPEQEKQIEALIQEALFNDPNSPRIGAKQAKLTLINFT
ncbi:hypothetical protein AB9D26_16065, partial [Citrobacter freundii]